MSKGTASSSPYANLSEYFDEAALAIIGSGRVKAISRLIAAGVKPLNAKGVVRAFEDLGYEPLPMVEKLIVNCDEEDAAY